jgi:hypothetical protein
MQISDTHATQQIPTGRYKDKYLDTEKLSDLPKVTT